MCRGIAGKVPVLILDLRPPILKAEPNLRSQRRPDQDKTGGSKARLDPVEGFEALVDFGGAPIIRCSIRHDGQSTRDSPDGTRREVLS
jgi:hypothetical protein